MSENDRFDALAQEFFNDATRRDPILATDLGLHQYDGLLPDASRTAKLAEIERRKQFLNAFTGLDRSALSFDHAIDRDLGIQSLRLALLQDEKIGLWRSFPIVGDELGTAFFLFFARDFVPLPQRMQSIASRMENMPTYIEQAKSRLDRPVKLWVEVGAEAVAQLPFFLQFVLETARGQNVNVTSRLERAYPEAARSLQDYGEWLQREKLPGAREDWAVGKAIFNEILAVRGLGMDADEMLAFGERALTREQGRLQTLAERIRPTATVAEIKEQIKASHPQTFDEVLAKVRTAIQSARRFVQSAGFATVPEGEELSVVATPEFLRHVIPFAAYFAPAPFDARRIGVYMVTPPEGNLERLKEHSYVSISNTAVHEGYPGHHLQLTYAARHSSLIRMLPLSQFQAAEFVEGWAHYCEEAMQDRGFDDLLEARFMQAVDMVWRAVRIIVDIKLCTGRMTVDEAVSFLVQQVGMDPEAAQAEVRRYTYAPTYQLSYYLGKYQILRLKEETKKRLGFNYSDQRFHDALLTAGNLPMKFMRQVIKTLT